VLLAVDEAPTALGGGGMPTIRQLREERGWTQLHLAIQLGVTPVTIYNWERGNSEPRVTQFRQLARLFGVSMDDLALTSEADPAEAPSGEAQLATDR
jgi:transcriptional regulator with XRE-family HTH domain